MSVLLAFLLKMSQPALSFRNVIHNVANDAYSRTMHSSETLHRPTGSPLTGIEAFTLEYAVQWPISIVLSKKAMTKYELLFRHIFFIKHVERQIGITWRYQQRFSGCCC